MTKHLNFKISEQKINICSKVRYLGVILEEHLRWNLHINSLKCKLNRAIGILSKIQHYVPKFLFNTLYYTIFHSHLIYSCQIWVQNNTILRKLELPQNKALRIINFKNTVKLGNFDQSGSFVKDATVHIQECLFIASAFTKIND